MSEPFNWKHLSDPLGWDIFAGAGRLCELIEQMQQLHWWQWREQRRLRREFEELRKRLRYGAV